MTPDTQQARAATTRGGAPPYSPVSGRAGLIAESAIAGGRPGRTAAAEAAPARQWSAVAQPSNASPAPKSATERPQSMAAAERAREDASIVGVVPLVAVLVVTTAGVYLAWRQGSARVGEGGVVAGVALLVGAVARLLLPPRLAGLLATRKRATDVITFTIFGASLLVAGLVLPR